MRPLFVDEMRGRLARALAVVVVLALWCAAAVMVRAAEPPTRVVIAYPPGGGTDIVGRIVLAQVEKNTGWRVVIENVPGATGVIGTRQAAAAAPDGRTLLLGHTAPNAINPGDFTDPRQPVDWRLDPVALVARAPSLLLVRPEVGAPGYGQLVAWLRKAPRTYGSDGVGSQAHLLMAGLLHQLGAERGAVHVPYKGGAPALQGLMGGDVPVAFSPAPVALPHVTSGRFVVVAQTGDSRLPSLHDVPTLQEMGGPVLPALWWGLFAPVGTPEQVVQAWAREVARALHAPAVVDALARQGLSAAYMPPGAFGAMLDRERRMYSAIGEKAQ